MAEHATPTQQQIDAHLAYSTAELLNNGVGELFRAEEDFQGFFKGSSMIDRARDFVVAEAPLTVVTIDYAKLGWDKDLTIGKVINGKTALHMVDVVTVNENDIPRIHQFCHIKDLSVDSPIVQSVLRIEKAQQELGWRPESPLISSDKYGR